HHPLRLLPAGATVAGRDSHPLRIGAFSRRTLKYTLGARLEPPGTHEAVEGRTGDAGEAVSLAMAGFGTPRSRKRRMSSSLPLSRETPNEPFGRPSFLPEALAGALGDQVALDLGEQREEGGHDFGLDIALALDADVLLYRHEGDACLGEGSEDGDDLTQRPTEPGEFADDQTVAALSESGLKGRNHRPH
ncbi:MAG: hypothetical protein OXB98_16410, partial [Bryobacterales bacterium]|nr:hypothetical protein [Bryobacterales bacterium]